MEPILAAYVGPAMPYTMGIDNILSLAGPLLMKAQKHVANSTIVAAKGLSWNCKCSEVKLQCTTHLFLFCGLPA